MTKTYINARTCIGAVAFGAAAGLLAMANFTSAQESPNNDELFAVTAAISLPGGKLIKTFDISYADAVLGRYVLGDRTNAAVDLIDTSNNTVIALLTATPPFAGATGNNNTSGPDGVIIVRAKDNGDGVDEVFAGDGPTSSCPLTASSPVPQKPGDPRCSTVKVIALDGTMEHVIPTGGMNRADENCLDTKDGLLMTANNADNPPFGTIISTKTYAVTNQVSFPFSTNGAEQCQWSPRTGLFYITIPGIDTPDLGHGEVLAIDPNSGKIVQTFDIALQVCGTPQGMAVGPNSQIMIGCNEGSGPSTNGLHSGIVINEKSGSVIGVIPDESGPDEIYYNEGDGQYFLARSAPPNHTDQLLGVVDANGKRADQSVETVSAKPAGRSAHSVAADAGTNKVFVPIPAVTAPTTSVCHLKGGIDAVGCIAVFQASPDDKGKAIVGRDNNNDQGEDN